MNTTRAGHCNQPAGGPLSGLESIKTSNQGACVNQQRPTVSLPTEYGRTTQWSELILRLLFSADSFLEDSIGDVISRSYWNESRQFSLTPWTFLRADCPLLPTQSKVISQSNEAVVVLFAILISLPSLLSLLDLPYRLSMPPNGIEEITCRTIDFGATIRRVEET